MYSNKKEAYIQELVELAQQGDNDAFGDIYSLFLDDIYRFVYFKVSSEEVEDITENIFIKAWQKIHLYNKGGGNFRSWVFSIARNTVIDHYRTKKQATSLEEVGEIADDSTSPSWSTEQSLNKEILQAAIAQLPENYREIITLKFVNELSNEEIEAVTKRQQASIRILQFRGLKKLRAILGKHGEHLT